MTSRELSKLSTSIQRPSQPKLHRINNFLFSLILLRPRGEQELVQRRRHQSATGTGQGAQRLVDSSNVFFFVFSFPEKDEFFFVGQLV
jgi:hypothetical protein